jgi:hypothetical protein
MDIEKKETSADAWRMWDYADRARKRITREAIGLSLLQLIVVSFVVCSLLIATLLVTAYAHFGYRSFFETR